MENLEGTLGITSIQSVLKILAAKNPACSWFVSDGWNEKVFYFSTGGVRLYTSEGRRIARLEDYLVRSGVVSREEMDFALDVAKKDSSTRLVDVLELKGIVSGAKVQEGLCELVYFELCDLVTWESAFFEFYEGNPPPEIFDSQHPAVFGSLDIPDLADRVRAWSVEWAQLKSKLYSERLRPSLVTDQDQAMDQLDLMPSCQPILRLMDGQRSLREIALASSSGFPEVARTVQTGLQEKCLRASLVKEKKAVEKPEILDEIEKLEDALDRAINKILVHKRIASGYEQIGEGDRASEHLYVVGNLNVQAGRSEAALDSYRKSVNLSPQNVSAHESLIRTLNDTGDEEGALDEIFALAKNLVTFGFVERACSSLRALTEKVVNRFDIRMFFADTLFKSGCKSEAVREYLGIADAKRSLGHADGLEEIYRKILIVDPVNRHAREGLKREKKRRVGSRVIWLHRLSSIAAGLLLVCWLVSEGLARYAWANEKPEIARLVESGQIDTGLQKLRAVALKFPGTFLAQQLCDEEFNTFKSAFYGLEENLTVARQGKAEGKLVESRELLVHVMDNSMVDSQVSRAGESVEMIDDYRETWARTRRRSEKLLQARYRREAFRLARQVIENYPEGAQDLKIPFLIQSTPDGALVSMDGINAGYTPLWISVRFGRPQDLVVKYPGREDVDLDGIEQRESPFVNVSFGKSK